MCKGKKIGFLAFLFVIVVAMFVCLYNYNTASSQEVVLGTMTSYVEVMGEKEVSSNRVIVSDKFVGKIEKDAKVVVLNGDGSAYVVQSGVVLVDDTVVAVTDDTYSVYRIDEPAKSVSS